MSLDDYDQEAIEGTALCIDQPETPYDHALRSIFDWYDGYYARGFDPPQPLVLLKRFHALAESEEDYTEGVEIAIHLAWHKHHSDAVSEGQIVWGVIRVLGIMARFLH